MEVDDAQFTDEGGGTSGACVPSSHDQHTRDEGGGTSGEGVPTSNVQHSRDRGRDQLNPPVLLMDTSDSEHLGIRNVSSTPDVNEQPLDMTIARRNETTDSQSHAAQQHGFNVSSGSSSSSETIQELSTTTHPHGSASSDFGASSGSNPSGGAGASSGVRSRGEGSSRDCTDSAAARLEQQQRAMRDFFPVVQQMTRVNSSEQQQQQQQQMLLQEYPLQNTYTLMMAGPSQTSDQRNLQGQVLNMTTETTEQSVQRSLLLETSRPGTHYHHSPHHSSYHHSPLYQYSPQHVPSLGHPYHHRSPGHPHHHSASPQSPSHHHHASPQPPTHHHSASPRSSAHQQQGFQQSPSPEHRPPHAAHVSRRQQQHSPPHEQQQRSPPSQRRYNRHAPDHERPRRQAIDAVQQQQSSRVENPLEDQQDSGTVLRMTHQSGEQVSQLQWMEPDQHQAQDDASGCLNLLHPKLRNLSPHSLACALLLQDKSEVSLNLKRECLDALQKDGQPMTQVCRIPEFYFPSMTHV